MQGVLDGKKHNYEKLELVINRERWAMNRDGNTGTSACGVLEIKTPSGCCRIDIPVCENLPEVQEGTFVDRQSIMQTGRMDMQRMVSGKEKTKRYGFNASGTMEKRGLP